MTKVNIEDIKLIIGLGNSGTEYEKTYHNVGILFIKNKIPLNSKFQNPKSKNFGFFKLKNYILIKSLTFMNESGKAVREAMKYFSVKPEEILVVHDDSDIGLGKYKTSFARSSAGHRGVESIIKSIGTKNFWRLRIGIGKISNIKNQKSKRIKAGKLVLKRINQKDLEILEKVFQTIKDEININNDDKR